MDEDVFTLGATSLLAAELQDKLQNVVGRHVPLAAVFEATTPHKPDLNSILPKDIEIETDLKEKDGQLYACSKEVVWEGALIWIGTKEDLKQLVLPHLEELMNWSRPGLEGEICQFEYRHFVDGNADL